MKAETIKRPQHPQPAMLFCLNDSQYKPHISLCYTVPLPYYGYDRMLAYSCVNSIHYHTRQRFPHIRQLWNGNGFMDMQFAIDWYSNVIII